MSRLNLADVFDDPLSLNAFVGFLRAKNTGHVPYFDFCHAAGRWARKRTSLTDAEEQKMRDGIFTQFLGPEGQLNNCDLGAPPANDQSADCLLAAHQHVMELLSTEYLQLFEQSEHGAQLIEKQNEIGAIANDAILLDGIGLNYIVKYIRRVSPLLEEMVYFCVDFRRRKRAQDQEKLEQITTRLLKQAREKDVLIQLTAGLDLGEEELMVKTNSACLLEIGKVVNGFIASEEGQEFGTQKAEEAELERQAEIASIEADKAEAKVEMTRHKDEKVTLDSFDVQQVLGKGSYGTVLKVIHKASKIPFALKVIQKGKMTAADAKRVYLREKDVLEAIGTHPFVVSLRHCFTTPEKFYLTLDFCSGGDLDYNLSQTRTGTFDQPRAVFYASELTLALEHLHHNCILYRDLKPENVLLDHEGHCKLVDFGISRTVLTSPENCQAGEQVAPGILSHVPGDEGPAAGEDTNRTNRRRPAAFTFCGSPAYLSPEMVAKRGHGYEVDWFGLGALIYEMLVGLPPFYSENLNLMLRDIRWRDPRMPSSLPSTARRVITGLLAKNPAERLTGEGLKKAELFDGIDWDALLARQVEPPFIPMCKEKEGVMAKLKHFFSNE